MLISIPYMFTLFVRWFLRVCRVLLVPIIWSMTSIKCRWASHRWKYKNDGREGLLANCSPKRCWAVGGMRDILEGRLLLCENKSSQLVSQSYCALGLLLEASMFNFGIARHSFSCQTIKCLLKVDEVEKEIPLVLQIYFIRLWRLQICCLVVFMV